MCLSFPSIDVHPGSLASCEYPHAIWPVVLSNVEDGAGTSPVTRLKTQLQSPWLQPPDSIPSPSLSLPKSCGFPVAYRLQPASVPRFTPSLHLSLDVLILRSCVQAAGADPVACHFLQPYVVGLVAAIDLTDTIAVHTLTNQLHRHHHPPPQNRLVHQRSVATRLQKLQKACLPAVSSVPVFHRQAAEVPVDIQASLHGWLW